MRATRLIISVFFIISLVASCTGKHEVVRFSNLTDIRYTPSSSMPATVKGFSDNGSWLGYLLPSDSDAIYRGSVTGPWFAATGKYLSQSLFVPSITIGDQFISPAGYSDYIADYYPGLIGQRFIAGGMEVVVELFFSDRQSAVASVRIKNITENIEQVRVDISGKLFEDAGRFVVNGGYMECLMEGFTETLFIAPVDQSVQITVDSDSLQYGMKMAAPVSLNPGTEHVASYVFQLADGRESGSLYSDIRNRLFDYNRKRSESVARWDRYIKTIVDGSQYAGDSLAEALVRGVVTLTGNMKSPLRDFPEWGLLMSPEDSLLMSYRAIDQWFGAAALSLIEPEIAKSVMRGSFNIVSLAGVLPERNAGTWENSLFLITAPPVATWAVSQIYRYSSDTAFLREMYPSLVSNHYYWYKERDINKNGMAEYGVNTKDLEIARLESGGFNPVRFSGSSLLQSSFRTYSLSQESSDLNALLYKEKIQLADIAELLGYSSQREEFSQSAARLKDSIASLFWSHEKRFFFDRNLGSGSLIEVYGTDGLTHLWTGSATDSQAAEIISRVTDSAYFATFFPLAGYTAHRYDILSAGTSGSVHPEQYFYVVEGLKGFGFKDEAEKLISRYLLHTSNGFYESWSATDAKGEGYTESTLSAAVALLISRNRE
jgi:putative isomerase